MGLPHVRGGVSTIAVGIKQARKSSPRPWGCFSLAGRIFKARRVFPTSVGVFPIAATNALDDLSLPHVRGGVSWLREVDSSLWGSSPRPWGCFYLNRINQRDHSVFPTSVGVFL